MARSGTGYRLGGSVKGNPGSRHQMAQWALSPPRHGRYRGEPDKRARQIRGSYSRVVGGAEGAIDYVVCERIACVQLIACAAYTRRFDELHQNREASHGALPFSLTLLIIKSPFALLLRF